jgi:predicted O-methyltransferase YrrM
MNINNVIDKAFGLYMPQIREEITELATMVNYRRKFRQNYNILEIGTKFGGTFLIWNEIVGGNGHCFSIDMCDGGLHGGIGDERMDERDQRFKERYGNCHFIRGNSHEYGTRELLISKMLECKIDFFDFIFIDGDHRYEGVKTDFLMYSPFLEINGLVAFHDIVDSQTHRDRRVHVNQLWNEVKDQYPSTQIIYGNNDWGGIGVLEMPA